MKNRNAFSIVYVSTCLMLSSCGGGGSARTPEPEVDTSSHIKGVVVDGYLVGAKVCLDLNTNWVCDIGEPSTVSGAGGQYTLDVAPLKYWDTYKSLVLAEVGVDVKDEATGKTLKEQGLAGYTLASSGGPRSILSPLNTMQIAQYMANGMKDLDEVSKVAQLLSENGMSASSDDYFDPTAPLTDIERSLAKRTARILASALGSAQARLKTEAPAVYAANAAGLGGRAASLVNQALADTRPASSAETEAEQLARIDQQVSSIPLNAESEKLLQKPVSVLTPSDALEVLGSGLYDAGLLASTPRNVLAYTAQGDGGSLTVKSLQYKGNTWTQDAQYQSQGGAGYRILYRDSTKIVGSQIASSFVSIQAPVLGKDGVSGLKEKFSGDAAAPARQVQVLVRDAEGLNFSAIPSLSSLSGSFGAGQKLYQVRRKTLVPEYVFDGVASFFTSLAAFKASPRTCYAGVCWTITRAAMGNFTEVAGTMKFSTTSSAGSLDLGEAKFIEDEIAGIKFLRMIAIPIAVQNKSPFWSAKDGRYPIFADFDGKLWTGRFAPSAAIWTSDWLMSRDVLNAVLATVPLSAVSP